MSLLEWRKKQNTLIIPLFCLGFCQVELPVTVPVTETVWGWRMNPFAQDSSVVEREYIQSSCQVHMTQNPSNSRYSILGSRDTFTDIKKYLTILLWFNETSRTRVRNNIVRFWPNQIMFQDSKNAGSDKVRLQKMCIQENRTDKVGTEIAGQKDWLILIVLRSRKTTPEA